MTQLAGWVEPLAKPIALRRFEQAEAMGIAEFIIGPAEGRTRWLYPTYDLQHVEAEHPVPNGIIRNVSSLLVARQQFGLSAIRAFSVAYSIRLSLSAHALLAMTSHVPPLSTHGQRNRACHGSKNC
jgi:hypothetical protein